MSVRAPRPGRAQSAGNVHRGPTGRGAQTRGGRQGGNEASRLAKEQQDVQMSFPASVNLGSASIDGQTVPSMDAVYSFPSAEKDKFAFRQFMRDSGAFASKVPGQVTNWQVQDADVDMMFQAFKERQQAEFEKWMAKHVDIRKPHNFEWLQRLAPEYIAKRVEQFQRKQNLAKRVEFIKNFGIHTRDDLMTKFMLDTQQLQDTRDPNDVTGYLPGMFAPPRKPIAFNPFTNMGDQAGVPITGAFDPAGFNPMSGQPAGFGPSSAVPLPGLNLAGN